MTNDKEKKSTWSYPIEYLEELEKDEPQCDFPYINEDEIEWGDYE